MFRPPDTHRQGISYKQYFFLAAMLILIFYEKVNINDNFMGIVNFKGY